MFLIDFITANMKGKDNSAHDGVVKKKFIKSQIALSFALSLHAASATSSVKFAQYVLLLVAHGF